MMNKIGSFYTKIDKIVDYIPVISTLTNLFDLIMKCFDSYKKQGSIFLKDRFWSHIRKKDNVDCVILLLPIFGNILVTLLRCNRKKQDVLKDELINSSEKNQTIQKEALKAINQPSTNPEKEQNNLDSSSLKENTPEVPKPKEQDQNIALDDDVKFKIFSLLDTRTGIKLGLADKCYQQVINEKTCLLKRRDVVNDLRNIALDYIKKEWNTILYSDDNLFDFSYEFVKQDFELAFLLLETRTNFEDPKIYYHIGVLLRECVKKDPQRTKPLLERLWISPKYSLNCAVTFAEIGDFKTAREIAEKWLSTVCIHYTKCSIDKFYLLELNSIFIKNNEAPILKDNEVRIYRGSVNSTFLEQSNVIEKVAFKETNVKDIEEQIIRMEKEPFPNLSNLVGDYIKVGRLEDAEKYLKDQKNSLNNYARVSFSCDLAAANKSKGAIDKSKEYLTLAYDLTNDHLKEDFEWKFFHLTRIARLCHSVDNNKMKEICSQVKAEVSSITDERLQRLKQKMTFNLAKVCLLCDPEQIPQLYPKESNYELSEIVSLLKLSSM